MTVILNVTSVMRGEGGGWVCNKPANKQRLTEMENFLNWFSIGEIVEII